MNKIICLLLLLLSFNIRAQHGNLPLGYDASLLFEKELNNTQLHTSFKPLVKSSVSMKIDLDSLYQTKFINDKDVWYKRKLFYEHTLILNGKDYKVHLSPIIHLDKGKDIRIKKDILTNTRGFMVEGDIGRLVSFSSSFLENQSIFPEYIDYRIRSKKVVPGQGFARDFKKTGFDYAMASGYVSVKPGNKFLIQFGHGKNFIGNGYRSLLISDNSFNYPFLRVQSNFEHIQYTNLCAELLDINYFEDNSTDNNNMGYAKKYLSSHYISANISSNINLGIFQSVIWDTNIDSGNKGFDIKYINPISLFRPLIYHYKTQHNLMLGINVKYKLPFRSYLYGQLVLDDFKNNKIHSLDYWNNSRYGYQFGAKLYDFLGIENLCFQLEYNLVRPFTYAEQNTRVNYAHYNQSLAHPIGANFSEKILIISYRKNRWGGNTKLIFTKYGDEIQGHTFYGHDIYNSIHDYQDSPNQLSQMYQGDITDILFSQLNVSYLINPASNLKIYFSIMRRVKVSQLIESNSLIYNIGVKTDLFNHYYDF